MRAFVCEVDHHGLRRLLPEDLLPAEELRRLARDPGRQPITVARALLEGLDAEALRAALDFGHHRHACGLLLNLAVELSVLGPTPS